MNSNVSKALREDMSQEDAVRLLELQLTNANQRITRLRDELQKLRTKPKNFSELRTNTGHQYREQNHDF